MKNTNRVAKNPNNNNMSLIPERFVSEFYGGVIDSKEVARRTSSWMLLVKGFEGMKDVKVELLAQGSMQVQRKSSFNPRLDLDEVQDTLNYIQKGMYVYM